MYVGITGEITGHVVTNHTHKKDIEKVYLESCKSTSCS